jgi:hypothetical protein
VLAHATMRNDSTSKSPGADPRKIAVASARRPGHLGVLGAGVLGTAALVLAGHPLLGVMVLALGVLAYGALIGLDMFDPRFIRRVHERDATAAMTPAQPAARATADQPGAPPAGEAAVETAAGERIDPPP